MNPVIDRKYRLEQVDLQPSGNSIVVETLSDNPFELADDVEVFTQESGGMAGPDSRQRSRGLLTKRPGVKLQRQGKARVIRTRAPAAFAHAAFMPGMGDLGAMKRRAAKMRRAKVAVPRARMINAAFMPGMGADPAPAPAAPSWATALSTGITAAGGVASNVFAAKQAEAQRRAAEAQARAEQARAEGSRVAAMYDAMAQRKGISLPLIGVAVAALAVAGFLWMGKKKSA